MLDFLFALAFLAMVVGPAVYTSTYVPTKGRLRSSNFPAGVSEEKMPTRLFR